MENDSGEIFCEVNLELSELAYFYWVWAALYISMTIYKESFQKTLWLFGLIVSHKAPILERECVCVCVKENFGHKAYINMYL